MKNLPLSAALALLACAGCGSTLEDYCERYSAECDTTQVVADCKAYADQFEIAAKEADCEAELDAWVRCLNALDDVCDEAEQTAACDEHLAALEQCGVDL